MLWGQGGRGVVYIYIYSVSSRPRVSTMHDLHVLGALSGSVHGKGTALGKPGGRGVGRSFPLCRAAAAMRGYNTQRDRIQ